MALSFKILKDVFDQQLLKCAPIPWSYELLSSKRMQYKSSILFPLKPSDQLFQQMNCVTFSQQYFFLGTAGYQAALPRGADFIIPGTEDLLTSVGASSSKTKMRCLLVKSSVLYAMLQGQQKPACTHIRHNSSWMTLTYKVVREAGFSQLTPLACVVVLFPVFSILISRVFVVHGFMCFLICIITHGFSLLHLILN